MTAAARYNGGMTQVSATSAAPCNEGPFMRCFKIPVCSGLRTPLNRRTHMFKKFGMLLVAACLLLPAQAKAADLIGVYVAPKFVLNIQHFKGVGKDFEGDRLPGSGSKDAARAGGALAIGYDFSPKFDLPVRAELEYAAYGNSSRHLGFIDQLAGDALSAKHTVRFQTLMANVYWDITDFYGFTPYVGGGLGMAFVTSKVNYNYNGIGESENNSFSDTDTVFAGQVGLGCSYAFTDNIAADFGYRFLMMGDAKASNPGMSMKSKDMYAHQLTLGLRVTF